MSVICLEKNFNRPIKNSASYLICAYGCSAAIHIRCSKLDNSALHLLNTNKNIKYCCDACSQNSLESVNKKILDLTEEIKMLSKKMSENNASKKK